MISPGRDTQDRSWERSWDYIGLKNSQSVLTKDNLKVPRAPSLQRSVGTFSTEEKGSRLTVRNQREAATNLAEASYLN